MSNRHLKYGTVSQVLEVEVGIWPLPIDSNLKTSELVPQAEGIAWTKGWGQKTEEHQDLKNG